MYRLSNWFLNIDMFMYIFTVSIIISIKVWFSFAGGSKMCQSAPVVTPKGLYVTSKGRILFLPLPPNQVCLQQFAYTAPEYQPQQGTFFSDSQLEKVNQPTINVKLFTFVCRLQGHYYSTFKKILHYFRINCSTSFFFLF